MKHLLSALSVLLWLVATGISFPLLAAKQVHVTGSRWVVLDEIEKHQAGYDKLIDDFESTIKRIQSSATQSAEQEHAYNQLSIVEEMLSSMNREFSVLDMAWSLSSLVTEKKNLKPARNIVERQLNNMSKKALDDAEFIEKKMPDGQEQEANRLLHKSKNLFHSSAELLERIKTGK